MLRPYRSSAPEQPTSAPFLSSTMPQLSRSKRTAFVLGLPILLLVGLVGMSNTSLKGFMPNRGMRKLVVQCIHNIYAESIQDAIDMPKPPTVSASTEVPSTYAICQEWIRREAQGTYQPLYTQEDDTVCMDWTSPHYRVMEILGSSILDRVNGLSRYRHDCYRSRTWDEGVTGYDRTTVQQMLPVARMTPNQDLFNSTEFKTQCKVCLEQFDPTIEKKRVKSAAFHHCFTWPETFEDHNYADTITYEAGLRGQKVIVPQNATKPNTAPITSVWKQIRNRLGYVSKVFSNVTDSPPNEHNSGVVIYIDPSTTGIAKEIYPTYWSDMDVPVTSVSVLASPLCAVAYLPTGQLCSAYAEELVTYFQAVLPSLTNTGFNGLNGIRFQMAASSAGLWSRAIRSKRLICPPTTPNCLIPAGSKLVDPLAGFDSYAYVLDSADSGKAIDFFNMVGHGDRVTVELLGAGDIPATVAKPVVDQQYTSTGEKVADEFTDVNQNTDSEGFTPGNTPDPAMSQSAAAAASDATVYADAAAVLPSNAENPNIYFPETEDVPSLEYITAKIAAGEPVNLNYSQENTTRRATDEMVADVDHGMAVREMTPDVLAEQTALRIASEARIKKESQAAKAAELATGDAPSMEMEIYCPAITDDGYPISIEHGTVEITKNDKVMISDGVGTAIFAKDGLNKETITIPRDPDTSLPYTHIYDPVTKQNITITGTNITINKGNGITQRDPIGILFVDNLTDPYSATLITEGGTGNLRAGNIQKKYTGTIISTGTNRADKGNVVRHGRGYAIQKYLEPGQKRTIYGWWNGFYSSQSLSSSESGGSGYEGSYSHHGRPGLSSSDEAGNGRSSDSRDIGREMDNGVQPKDMVRHLERGVSIKVNSDDYKRFGERRVCSNNKHKILQAQRRAREVAEQAKHAEGAAANKQPVVESIVVDAPPERRQLGG